MRKRHVPKGKRKRKQNDARLSIVQNLFSMRFRFDLATIFMPPTLHSHFEYIPMVSTLTIGINVPVIV
jgi:hypothetical protein